MVKKIVIFFSYAIFFVIALIYFTPKDSFYFLLENQLKSKDIIIDSEKVDDNGFSLSISDAHIYYKSIDGAVVKSTNIKIFGVYNSLILKQIKLSSTAKSFVPLNIESIDLVYSVLNPLSVNICAVGSFGKLKAEYNIMKNSVHLVLKPSKDMLQNYRVTMKNLTKTKEGEFVYDKAF